MLKKKRQFKLSPGKTKYKKENVTTVYYSAQQYLDIVIQLYYEDGCRGKSSVRA